MATLAIRYSEGTSAENFTTVLWLHSSTNIFDEGWKIRYDGWTQGITQVVNGEWTNVDERVTLRIVANDADDLSSKVITLDTFVSDLQFHLNANSNRVYWLFTALDDEAAPLGDENNQVYRMCPIINVASSYSEGLFGHQTSVNNTVLQYTIIFTRLPFWEGLRYIVTQDEYTSFSSAEGQSSISTVGGTMTLANTVQGTHDSRLMRFNFAGESGGGGPITEAWFGFRSSALGTPANFLPVWELEDAGSLGDDTSVVSEGSDTSPSSSTTDNKLRCTFATDEAMDKRAVISVIDVTNNVSDQRGRHLVLMRAKVTGLTAYVRMDSGYTSATNWRTGTRMLIDSTDWYLYSLGYITIPATRLSDFEALHGGGATFNKFGIRVNAQLASGSGSLDMDCLILIPQDEGAVYINDADIDYSDGVSGEAVIGSDPLGNSYEISTPAPSFVADKTLEAQFEHFAVPLGSGTVGILTAQRVSSQVLSDTLNINFLTRFRWRSLRGTQGWSIS